MKYCFAAAPNDALIESLKSNIRDVQAAGNIMRSPTRIHACIE